MALKVYVIFGSSPAIASLVHDGEPSRVPLLVAERRGRILGFLYATLEETSARIMFLAVLPEYRRRGIGTALHHELKAHIPREVAFVGVYALLDSPVIPFLEKIGYLPGKQYLWMDRYA